MQAFDRFAALCDAIAFFHFGQCKCFAAQFIQRFCKTIIAFLELALRCFDGPQENGLAISLGPQMLRRQPAAAVII